MATRISQAAVCVLSALLGGCTAPLVAFERALEEAGIAEFHSPRPAGASGRSVSVRQSLMPGSAAGRGAVVGEDLVLTVDHVVGPLQKVWIGTSPQGAWVEARVERRIHSWPESLVLLRLDVDPGLYGILLGFPGFAPEDCYRASRESVPALVARRRGLRPWGRGVLRPGDSGSPVLDAEGGLIGLVSGRRGPEAVMAALPPGEPWETEEVLLASR